jgi:SulP family sulfate permease
VRAFQECQNLPKRLDLIGKPLLLDSPIKEVSSIKPRDLWRKLQDDDSPVIIDVREPREFQQGHIQGARLISLPQLLADPLQVPREVPVVLTCRTERRSSRVAGKLIEMGYENLKILEGGLLAWEAENLLEAIE